MSTFRFEEWYEYVKDVHVPVTIIPLIADEQRAIVAMFLACEGGDDREITLRTKPALDELGLRVTAALAEHPEGVHMRLGSRSPKDSFHGHKLGFRCREANDILHVLTESERVYEDVSGDLREGRRTDMILQAWADILPEDEWRVFVCPSGVVAGVTQYHDDARVVESPFALRNAITAFVGSLALPAYLLPCTIDVAYLRDGRGWIVLELNPYPDPERPWLVFPGQFDPTKDTFLFAHLSSEHVCELRLARTER